jgi:ribosomal protein S12 methylthiotransferase accessory factor
VDFRQRDGGERLTAKTYFAGTHRAVDPETTWRRIQPLLPRFGVTRVADITGLDRLGLPVAIAVRPLSRSVAVSAGKGVSLAAAKVSAAMESLECAHAESVDRPLFFASRTELEGCRRAVDPASLPRLRGAAIDARTRIVWIEGIAIGDGAPMLVPYEAVHAHYDRHGLAGTGILQATTNGLSSGNTLAEAISHGLFEVIERDALNLWERGRPQERDKCRLELGFRDQGGAWRLVERLLDRGFGVAAWNITSSIGVPAFHCIIVDNDDPSGHPGTGTGCHPDASVALSRAITEAVQVRATYISGGRDDLVRREYDARNMDSFRWLLDRDGTAARIQFASIGSRTTPYFEADIDWAAALLARAGCGPVVVVDLSLPDTGIHVVRVVVPGLEGPPGAELKDGARAQAVQS